MTTEYPIARNFIDAGAAKFENAVTAFSRDQDIGAFMRAMYTIHMGETSRAIATLEAEIGILRQLVHGDQPELRVAELDPPTPVYGPLAIVREDQD